MILVLTIFISLLTILMLERKVNKQIIEDKKHAENIRGGSALKYKTEFIFTYTPNRPKK